MGSYGSQQQPRLHPPPSFHINAPQGWMNDPCAPGYDETTGTYHMFYQWNPKSCEWDNIAWGQLTSRDGIHWTHHTKEPVLRPSLPYDKDGIFTGCLHPRGTRGEKGALTVVYSSVCSIPIHWSRPYTRNCAGIALAVSWDGGKTWKKHHDNPILRGEPEDIAVTGFRDPYIGEWPALDALRGKRGLYGLVSGGIVGEGPTAFLYAISPDNLTTWEYLYPLVDMPVGFSAPGHWGANFGLNWECVNFMTLRSGSRARDVLLLGSEGGLKPGCKAGDDDAHGIWALWMSGSLKQTEKGARMSYDFGGFLDHGCFYAANSYEHPVTKARILWGWLREDDLPLARRASKGWAGYLSLPREVFLVSLENVVGALRSTLGEIASISTAETNRRDEKTVLTLGIKPLSGIETLRHDRPKTWRNESGIQTRIPLPYWELEATIRMQPGQRRVGFHVRHSNDMESRTSVYFSPDDETIVVDRSLSNGEADIGKSNMSGPFTLFTFRQDGSDVVEKLQLRIFSDGEVLEVFANDRFALSTMIYSDAETCCGITAFVEGGSSEMETFEQVSIWGMGSLKEGSRELL